nr:e3 ubiquitin-protein ligase pib1 [Quercus suber]
MATRNANLTIPDLGVGTKARSQYPNAEQVPLYGSHEQSRIRLATYCVARSVPPCSTFTITSQSEGSGGTDPPSTQPPVSTSGLRGASRATSSDYGTLVPVTSEQTWHFITSLPRCSHISLFKHCRHRCITITPSERVDYHFVCGASFLAKSEQAAHVFHPFAPVPRPLRLRTVSASGWEDFYGRNLTGQHYCPLPDSAYIIPDRSRNEGCLRVRAIGHLSHVCHIVFLHLLRRGVIPAVPAIAESVNGHSYTCICLIDWRNRSGYDPSPAPLIHGRQQLLLHDQYLDLTDRQPVVSNRHLSAMATEDSHRTDLDPDVLHDLDLVLGLDCMYRFHNHNYGRHLRDFSGHWLGPLVCPPSKLRPTGVVVAGQYIYYRQPKHLVGVRDYAVQVCIDDHRCLPYMSRHGILSSVCHSNGTFRVLAGRQDVHLTGYDLTTGSERLAPNPKPPPLHVMSTMSQSALSSNDAGKRSDKVEHATLALYPRTPAMSSPPHRHLPTSSHRAAPLRQNSDSSVRHRWPEYAPSSLYQSCLHWMISGERTGPTTVGVMVEISNRPVPAIAESVNGHSYTCICLIDWRNRSGHDPSPAPIIHGRQQLLLHNQYLDLTDRQPVVSNRHLSAMATEDSHRTDLDPDVLHDLDLVLGLDCMYRFHNHNYGRHLRDFSGHWLGPLVCPPSKLRPTGVVVAGQYIYYRQPKHLVGVRDYAVQVCIDDHRCLPYMSRHGILSSVCHSNGTFRVLAGRQDVHLTGYDLTTGSERLAPNPKPPPLHVMSTMSQSALSSNDAGKRSDKVEHATLALYPRTPAMSSPPHRHLPTSSHRAAPLRQNSDSSVRHRWPEYAPSAAGANPFQPGFGSFDLRVESTERKRRHTGLEHDGRSYPYTVIGEPSVRGGRPLGPSLPSSNLGASRTTAIDLVTPPRASAMSQPPAPDSSNSTERRRDSDMALPAWQPDGAVSSCPVCKTRFNIWYRKHHCRKCGRVVCAACSPHRITIPRQYIVQQPGNADASLSRDDEQASPIQRNPALGGGEIVRVCNPCVPDPWTPETQPAANTAEAREPVNAPTLANPQRESADDLRNSRQRSERYRYNPPPAQPPVPAGRPGSWSHQTPPPYRDMPPLGSLSGPLAPLPSSLRVMNSGDPLPMPPHSPAALQYSRGPLPGMLPPPLPSSSRPPAHRYSHSSAGTTIDPRRYGGHHRLRNPNWHPSPPNLPGEGSRPAPVASAPKRVVKEEDECPVCGIELPPNEQFRENHVQECISARFSSGATPPPSSAPVAATVTGEVVSTNTYPAVRTAAPTPSSPAAQSRPRATSYRPRGMAVYTATEKDCTNADGEAQECVICFEEFQPGNELGRMECLCKFHRVCIRSWFVASRIPMDLISYRVLGDWRSHLKLDKAVSDWSGLSLFELHEAYM